MKKIVIILLILIANFCFAQKEKLQLYIDIYKDIAIQEMQRSGVPAAITLAQGIQESRFGESELSQKSNNHFGIKCKLDWNGEKVYSDDDEKQECFRKYNTPQESYKDHSDFLKSRPHYAWLFSLDPTNYTAWAKGLKQSGYATEKDYPERLIGLIETYNLNQYTLICLNKKATSNNVVSIAKNNTQSSNKNTKNTSKPIATTVVEDEKDDSTVNKTKEIAVIVEENNHYPTTIFTINNTKVIYANAGTSILALANEYNISLSKIYEMNDMDEVEVLDKNKLIFLEKKQKKGIANFHTVLANETLQDIAQKEGVRLDMILEYNSVNKKLNPLLGEKIYLRSKAPKPPKMSLLIAANPINPTITTN
jgi:LysM repeat protein